MADKGKEEIMDEKHGGAVSIGEKPLTENEKVMEEQILKNQEAIKEIERRKEVRDSMKNCKDEMEEIPLKLDATEQSRKIENIHGYDFAVVNKAHINMNPPCKRPGFRILGLFRENDGEYQNWIEDLKDSGMLYWDSLENTTKCKLGDLHKVPLMKYMLLSKTKERDRSNRYVTEKIESLKQLHLENIQFSKKEFAENRKGTTQGKMGLSIDKKREKAQEKRKKSSRNKAIEEKIKVEKVSKKEVARVPRSMQLIQQQEAIILVMYDISKDVLSGKEDPEPAIMIVDAFDSCKEAVDYIETLKNDVYLMNIDVVAMYVWQYPEDVKYDEVEEKYRNAEQNAIMQSKKQASRDIKHAQAEAKMKGVQVATTDVLVKQEEDDKPKENPLDAYDIKKNKKMTFEEDVDISKLCADAENQEASLPEVEVEKIDEIYDEVGLGKSTCSINYDTIAKQQDSSAKRKPPQILKK